MILSPKSEMRSILDETKEKRPIEWQLAEALRARKISLLFLKTIVTAGTIMRGRPRRHGPAGLLRIGPNLILTSHLPSQGNGL
jgi:hypothetical protein